MSKNENNVQSFNPDIDAKTPINISDSARKWLEEAIEEEEGEPLLRAFVTGGGCSGFQYGFTFEEDSNEDDFVMEFGTIKLLVDSISYQYLVGATIDYKDELMGSQFVINNPNATTTCGCGSSFSV